MSMKDLEEMGILLPENKWGQSDLHTTVDKIQLVASGLLALGAVICGYTGNGGLLTWIGVGMFFIFVGWFTRICAATESCRWPSVQYNNSSPRQECTGSWYFKSLFARWTTTGWLRAAI